MRMHISIDDALVARLDRRVGRRRRSAFIAAMLRRVLDDEERWDEIEASLGTLEPQDHAWDADPAEWVREQRLGDARRVG